jgi:hypothetical protein
VIAWPCPGGVAYAQPERRDMEVECHISATPRGGLLRLDATARAKEPITGQYTLSVRKESSSGTSENLQSGGFSLPRDQERVLTTVVLEGSAQGHFAAKLSLEWDQGKVSCSLP